MHLSILDPHTLHHLLSQPFFHVYCCCYCVCRTVQYSTVSSIPIYRYLERWIVKSGSANDPCSAGLARRDLLMQQMFGDYVNGPRKSKLFWQPTMLGLVSWAAHRAAIPVDMSTCRPAEHTSRHFEFETGISEQGISGLLPLARTANCRATAGCATSRCLFLLVLPYV